MASAFARPSAFQAGRQLQLRQQGGGDVEVFGTIYLRDHDGVKSCAGFFYHLDQVAVEVRGVEGVGAVECGSSAPVEFLESLDDVFASRRLVVRGDGVFEV
jgi:hypothetical protein